MNRKGKAVRIPVATVRRALRDFIESHSPLLSVLVYMHGQKFERTGQGWLHSSNDMHHASSLTTHRIICFRPPFLLSDGPPQLRVTSDDPPAQVMKALENPSGPDTGKHLRHAAAAFNKDTCALSTNEDKRRWLNLDVVPKFLSTLACLTPTQPTSEALPVCAAAAAALLNIQVVISAPSATTTFLSMLVADKAACRALVHWGIACPEASQQLPQAHNIRPTICEAALVRGVYGLLLRPRSDQLWTPFMVCMSLLVTANGAIAAGGLVDSPSLNAAMREAATAGVVERVLGLAAQDPCGEGLPLNPTVSRWPHAYALSCPHCRWSPAGGRLVTSFSDPLTV